MKPHLLKGQLKPIISCPTSQYYDRLYYLLRLYQCVSLFQSNVSAKLVRVFAALCHNLDHHRFFAMQVLIKMVSPNTGYKKKGPYQCWKWERSRRNQSRLFPPRLFNFNPFPSRIESFPFLTLEYSKTDSVEIIRCN